MGEPSRRDAVKSILGFVVAGAEELFAAGAAVLIVLLDAPVPHAADIAVNPVIISRRQMKTRRKPKTMFQIVQECKIVRRSRLISQ